MRRKVDELRRDAAWRTPGLDGDDEPIHALPDAPLRKRGPVGISAGFHVLALFLLILASWRAAPAPERAKPDLSVVFQEPLREPPVPLVPPRAMPAPPARAPRPPEPAPPRVAERMQIAPPPKPKELPPPTPLPPPKRMGEQVPVPHYPVPGTVPPEEGKSGKPGPPVPEATPPEAQPGTPEGQSETDPGAGGPGSAGSPREGPATGPGAGTIPDEKTGRIEVPKLGGGGRRDGEGGGSRRGLDLRIPVIPGTLGDFSFDSKDYDWSDYWSQMYYAILRAWYNRLHSMFPLFERWSFQHGAAPLRGIVTVRFVIERNGSVSSITVIDPSTMRPLDDSASSALKEVILPRLPDDFTRDREGVTGRFSMDIYDLSSWKGHMNSEKRRGAF